MGFFSLFSAADVDEFAKSLAEDIAKRFPPGMDQAKETKISVDRLTRILEGTYTKAIDFQKNHKLGLYRKARLLNTFKWTLKELGYSEPFVEVATEGLVVYVSRGTSKKS